MEELLKVKNLNYKLFKNLNLVVPTGSFISLSGSNNSGKTTLIKLLGGLLPTQNTILLNNVYLESYDFSELYQLVGVVISSELDPFLFDTVEKELLFVLHNNNPPNKKKRYQEIIKLFNLESYLYINPNTLNYNLKIKLSLALSLLTKPKLLLLDNITVNMTKEEKIALLNILKHFNIEEHLTIIMATLDLNDTITTDYLYILNNGSIALAGTPEEVLIKDNILNKLGLRLPFMYDLEVKLKDYNLITDFTLDMSTLVGALWK
jgi:energy-coupling factor transporter ATP-binding protein EcfA2